MLTPPFQIKDFDALSASLLNYVYKSDNALTDFNVGSAMRSILESFASEMEENYFRLWQAVQTAQQNSIYESFNFTPMPGVPATGQISFNRETPALTDLAIPSGTFIDSPQSIRYQTTAAVTLLSGTTSISAPATAFSSGANTNIFVVGTVMQIENPIAGISFAQTATQFYGGADTENPQSVVSRFNLFINSLQRGMIPAIEFGALTANLTNNSGQITEFVDKVVAIDYSNNTGLVNVYIDNGQGAASSNLIAKAQKIINGYIDDAGTVVVGFKSAGVVAVVQAVTALNQAVEVAIKVNGTFLDVQPYAQAAINNYFAGLGIGDTLNKEKLVADIFYSNPNIIDVVLTLPSGNVTTSANQRVILTTTTITQEI